MPSKYLFVFIHIRNKDQVGTVRCVKSSSNFYTDHSKALLLLWILSVIYVSCRFVSSYCLVTWLERPDLLAVLHVVFSFVFATFSIWLSGSGVVLNCIDS